MVCNQADTCLYCSKCDTLANHAASTSTQPATNACTGSLPSPFPHLFRHLSDAPQAPWPPQQCKAGTSGHLQLSTAHLAPCGSVLTILTPSDLQAGVPALSCAVKPSPIRAGSSQGATALNTWDLGYASWCYSWPPQPQRGCMRLVEAT